jgi:hypothetical protein
MVVWRDPQSCGRQTKLQNQTKLQKRCYRIFKPEALPDIQPTCGGDRGQA